MTVHRTVCQLCGKGELRFLFKSEVYHFDECYACGYVRRRENADLSYYTDDTYLEQWKDEAYHRRNARMLLDDCERFVESRGTILDIGCSVGFLLSEAQQSGWTPYGMDVSETAIGAAKERGLENVQQKSILDAMYPAETFDLVIFKHVLEHLDDPVGILKKIASWVKPGGLLYIGVPNFASYSSWRDGYRWTSLFPKEHISQFTPQTLKMVVEETIGFRVLEVKGNHSYGTQPKNLKAKINNAINRVKDRLMVGRDMLMIANKPLS